MLTFIAGPDLRFRPDSAELIEGATAKLQFKLANAVRSSSVSGTPTVVCTDLTFASTTLSGTTLTTLVSGGSANRNYVIEVTMVTTAGETMKGSIEMEWKDFGFEERAGHR